MNQGSYQRHSSLGRDDPMNQGRYQRHSSLGRDRPMNQGSYQRHSSLGRDRPMNQGSNQRHSSLGRDTSTYKPRQLSEAFLLIGRDTSMAPLSMLLYVQLRLRIVCVYANDKAFLVLRQGGSIH